MKNPPALNKPQVLRLAAHIIRSSGLCQMAWKSPEGKICTNGAIGIAVGLDPDWADWAGNDGTLELKKDAFQIARSFAGFLGGRGFGRRNDLLTLFDVTGFICNWNNAPEQTTETVARAMERAADELDIY